MAIISIDIDDRDLTRVENSIAENFKRKVKVDNPLFDPSLPIHPVQNPEQIDNPESKADFMNRILREFLAGHVASREVREARRVAGAGVDSSVRITKGA